MRPPQGADETETVGSDDRIAPVISLAGARAARLGQGAAAGIGATPPTEPPADPHPAADPHPTALTVIEHRKPTTDELRALEERVRQIEATPPEETRFAQSADRVDEPGMERAARRAENVALHAITRRGQSRAEIADLLARRELPADIIEAELERLAAVGLIDDQALARDLVDRLRSRKKLGSSALRAELQRRRLDRETIEAALSSDPDDDLDTMVDELARDRARRLGGLDRATAERRLIDYLARKGHTGSSAREAARRALDGEGRASGGPSSRGLGAGRRPVEFH